MPYVTYWGESSGAEEEGREWVPNLQAASPALALSENLRQEGAVNPTPTISYHCSEGGAGVSVYTGPAQSGGLVRGKGRMANAGVGSLPGDMGEDRHPCAPKQGPEHMAGGGPYP